MGLKKPNAFGLHDMTGNVWEWCEDWFDYYPLHPQVRNHGTHLPKIEKVIRGGSWFDSADWCRSSFRHRHGPESASLLPNIGLRVVMEE